MFKWLVVTCVLLLSACGGGQDSGVPGAPQSNGQIEQPEPSQSLYSSSPHRRNFNDEDDLSAFFTFFDHQYLNRIDIIITEARWQALLAELEDNLHSDEYFKADVIISSNGGLHLEVAEVGLRIRGNSTRQIPQQNGRFMPVHFKLKFNLTFDIPEDTLAYKVRKERRVANLRSLNLKSHQRIPDTSQIRELYSYDLFNQIGVAAPLTGSARVFLTIGQFTVDYGYYTAVEPIDKTFLRKRYGDDDNEGNLYKCLWQAGGPANLTPKHPDEPMDNWIGVSDELGYNPTYDLKTNEDEADHSRLLAFIDKLNTLHGAELKAWLDETFEVDQFLRYSAMNVLIGMPDDYRAMGNNYYLYFSASESDDDEDGERDQGKVLFIPYDYDQAFGGGWMPFDTASVGIYDWRSLTYELTGDQYYDAHPLIDKMLDIDEYRQWYEHYLGLYVHQYNGNFNSANFKAKFDQLKALYDSDGSGELESQIEDNIKVMQSEQEVEYFNTKVESIRSQLGQ